MSPSPALASRGGKRTSLGEIVPMRARLTHIVLNWKGRGGGSLEGSPASNSPWRPV